MNKRLIIPATPAARKLAEEKGIDLIDIKGTGEYGSISKMDMERHRKAYKVTPVARKMAAYLNIDINDIKAEGKITRRDVEKAIAMKETPKKVESPTAPKEWGTKDGKGKRIRIEGMRKVIAARMKESLDRSAQYTMCSEFDTTALLKLVKEARQSYGKFGKDRLTVTDFLVKITALALKKHPVINSSVDGEEIVYYDDIHMGVAVALDEGLIVPVIRNADKLSVGQISGTLSNLVNRARQGRLLPDEYTGSTFTISNLGMYPVDFSTPVINQPESGILGVGRSQDKTVVIDGEIKIRSMTGFSLTLDHRVVDGAEGAKFLKTLQELLADPLCAMVL